MECVAISTLSIAINGDMHEYFYGSRGLRLFSLCLKVSSKMLKDTTMQSDFHFHSMYVATEATYLVYVYELLIFSQGDESTITYILDYLWRFGDSTRLWANLHKSNIYMAGVDSCIKVLLLEILSF